MKPAQAHRAAPRLQCKASTRFAVQLYTKREYQMKKNYVAIVLSSAVFAAVAAQPSNRDAGEMKSVAVYAVQKELVKTGEPLNIGKDNFEVSVTMAGKECKVYLRPNDEETGPWRWKVAAMNCPK